jgi:hypothetical protein
MKASFAANTEANPLAAAEEASLLMLSFRFGDTEIDNSEGEEEHGDDDEEDPKGCTRNVAATRTAKCTENKGGSNNNQHEQRGRIIVLSLLIQFIILRQRDDLLVSRSNFFSLFLSSQQGGLQEPDPTFLRKMKGYQTKGRRRDTSLELQPADGSFPVFVPLFLALVYRRGLS